ncbi:hypothetical protein GCM10008170_05680 [Methylopila capsulata]|uniref:Uncharacterized protein n=1 Tax=Methylopila capsulata TaxID=61654 RepID=A0A9W6ISH9_9HYPH|nr:hypothetical protein GCM10008170_05680 [Methylopila capsulata]
MALVFAMPIACCQIIAKVGYERSQWLAALQGATGFTPTDAYPVTDAKAFVVDAPTAASTPPATKGTPAVSRAWRPPVSASPATGAAPGAADSWILNWRGAGRPRQTLPICPDGRWTAPSSVIAARVLRARRPRT